MCLSWKVIFILSVAQLISAKFLTPNLCLNNPANAEYKITCENANERLFITEQRYSNDNSKKCNFNETVEQDTNECFGYKQNLIELCNGKSECRIPMDIPSFKFGFLGSNCDFEAQTLQVSYECVPVDYNDKAIPKYDICATQSIDHAVHGFIHSPYFPDSYVSNTYCQLTINIDIETQRLEVYLIDLELEGLSKRKHVPTDFLQINSREMLFGNKKMRVAFNSTEDAVFTFKSDTWFNYRGFVLYFKVITKLIEIEETTTKAPSTTTTTTTQISELTTRVSNQTETWNETKASTTTDKMEMYTEPIKLNIKQADDYFAKISNGAISNQVFVILMAIIGIMSMFILFLLFSNKKKFFHSGDIYKGADPSQPDLYIKTTNNNMMPYNGFINPLIQHHGYKMNILTNQSNQPRTSNESMAHLLMNSSRNSSYIDPSAILVNAKTGEYYEDISMKGSKHYFNMNKKGESENVYCDSPLITNNLVKSQAKLNEYCYIPGTMLQAHPSMYHNQQVIAEALRSNYEVNEARFQSTPSAPKTMPPSMNDSSVFLHTLDTTNESGSTRASSESLNRQQKPVEVNSEESAKDVNDVDVVIDVKQDSEEVDEYQVPLNLPA